MTDNRDPVAPDEPFEYTIEPMQEGKAWSFSLTLKYLPLVGQNRFSHGNTNKLSLPILRDKEVKEKIVVIHPLPNESTQQQLDFIKEMVRNLQPDPTVKLIAIYAVEASQDFDKNRVAFNKQIAKLTAGIDGVIFISSNAISGENMMSGVSGDAYIHYNKETTIPPNLRVNFNLLLNYYCNSQ